LRPGSASPWGTRMASRDDVYAKFGITAEAAQLLETSLGTALMAIQGLQNSWHLQPQPEEAQVAWTG
jgi:hypothetical protein